MVKPWINKINILNKREVDQNNMGFSLDSNKKGRKDVLHSSATTYCFS